MIVIDKWKGLVTNASPYAIPPGAAVTQVNFQCVRPGELTSRFGQTSVTFTTHTGATTAPVVMVRHQLGAQECVVYQNAAGALIVAKGLA
jgi:hypothetical protein